MQGDIFTSTNKQNSQQEKEAENNFFLQQDSIAVKNITPTTKRHLNDYDFNLLKEDAYKDVSDDVFKLEYQISKTEETISNLDKQINAAKEIRDFELAETLFEERKKLQEDLVYLSNAYKNASLSAKISGGYTSKFINSVKELKNGLINSVENIISRLPGRFSSIIEIKNSLDKLENINKSVNELMSMQIPYGESSHKYDTLSKYIVKANAIQTEISKYMK